VGDFLPGVLKSLGLSQGIAAQRAVAIWEEVVGELIARNTRALGMKGDVLWVLVKSPPWMQELKLLKEVLITRLNERLGEKVVKDIRLRLGS
jgi:predicted nucleic acid-binding Zn ribbon protein